jgi:hypothetical protein
VFDLTRTTLEYHEQRRKFLGGSLKVLSSTSSHPWRQQKLRGERDSFGVTSIRRRNFNFASMAFI